MQLAQQLRAYRERHGLTQQDVASFCYVTKATVSKWENGLSTPDVALLPLLASRFGTTVDALIGYEATRSKEDVRAAYARYATRFQHEPFQTVYEAIVEDARLHYRFFERESPLRCDSTPFRDGMIVRSNTKCQF